MDNYEKLRELLDAHPSGAPPSKIFGEILRILFSPDEAALASQMTLTPHPIEAIAAAAGISVEKAGTMLEGMAERVVIFSGKRMESASMDCCPPFPVFLNILSCGAAVHRS